MKPIGPTHRPHPEEVTRSLLRVTVSKDGSGRDLACGRPSRRRALRKRAPPQDEDYGCADMIPTSETRHYSSAPLLPKFVSEGAAMYHELRKRGTSRASSSLSTRLTSRS